MFCCGSLLDRSLTQILSYVECVGSLSSQGLVKKEIASQLEIGYSTVDTHVGRIYDKLNVSNAPSAVDKAHRLNLFPPEEPKGT